MAFAFIFIGSTVMATNNIKTEIISENSDEWVEIKNENGVKVYIKEYTHTDGTLALKVKFENSTNQEVKLTWSLINKNSKKSLVENHSVIEPEGFLVFINEENPIPVNYGETVNDLSIILK